MSKAVLVIDMPDNCASCKFLNDSYDYPECIITGETRGYNFEKYEKKMDKCPLQEMPEKSHTGKSDYYQWGDWEDGWNACIDGLLPE